MIKTGAPQPLSRMVMLVNMKLRRSGAHALLGFHLLVCMTFIPLQGQVAAAPAADLSTQEATLRQAAKEVLARVFQRKISR